MQLVGVTNQEVIPEYIAMKTPIYQKVMLVIIVFFLPLYDYKYTRWAKQAYEFLEIAILSHTYVHITYLSPTDNVQIWYVKYSLY
jgi:hypothetical protein